MKKVSFDFDETLSRPEVQEYAAELLANGIDVWVVTTRYDENHKHRYPFNATLDDLWQVVDKIGIPRWKVRFTCFEYKHTYLDGTDFRFHLDDNLKERELMCQNGCDVPFVYVNQNDWRERCDFLIYN